VIDYVSQIIRRFSSYEKVCLSAYARRGKTRQGDIFLKPLAESMAQPGEIQGGSGLHDHQNISNALKTYLFSNHSIKRKITSLEKTVLRFAKRVLAFRPNSPSASLARLKCNEDTGSISDSNVRFSSGIILLTF
jgi:hypothetical protein